MCACIRSDNVHLCRRKVIIPGVLQHFRPGWKDQTKSRGRTHTNIDTHKYTQTYIHIYACTPPISCCLFISPASAVASRLDSVYRETRDKREHCSAFYLHQVIRRMQLASSIRINTPVCVCGCVRKCVCVCVCARLEGSWSVCVQSGTDCMGCIWVGLMWRQGGGGMEVVNMIVAAGCLCVCTFCACLNSFLSSRVVLVYLFLTSDYKEFCTLFSQFISQFIFIKDTRTSCCIFSVPVHI